MAATRIQRRVRETNDRLRYREALVEIRELVSKRQLPLTNQIFEIADAAIRCAAKQEA